MGKLLNLYRTPTEWSTDNPVLGLGQVGMERFTRKTKLGDGRTKWNDLNYQLSFAEAQAMIDEALANAVPEAPPVTAADVVDAVEYYGHSYGAGAGARSPNTKYSTRLARALSAAEINFCNSGTRIINEGPNAGSGGWTYVGVNRVPSGRSPGHEYDAPAQVISIDYGINEFIGGEAAPNMTQLAHAFRTVISHCRAARRFSDNDAGLSYTGGFAGQTNYPDAQVGKCLRGSAGAGATVTFAVPSSFPGGVVSMSFVGGLNRGAQISFTVDGVSKGTMDMRNTHPTAGHFNSATKRLTGLSAGAHTVVATVLASDIADVFFDCASIEATQSALIIVHNIARTPQYAGPFTTQNDTIASVVAEFDESVKYFDIDTILGGGAVPNFSTDNLHPSDLGHALIAKGMNELLEANIDLIPSVDAVLLG